MAGRVGLGTGLVGVVNVGSRAAFALGAEAAGDVAAFGLGAGEGEAAVAEGPALGLASTPGEGAGDGVLAAPPASPPAWVRSPRASGRRRPPRAG